MNAEIEPIRLLALTPGPAADPLAGIPYQGEQGRHCAKWNDTRFKLSNLVRHSKTVQLAIRRVL